MKRAPSAQAKSAPPPPHHHRGRNGAVAANNGAHGGDHGHGDHRRQQQQQQMTLDVRSYESLECAIERVRIFLERSRRVALDEEDEGEEDMLLLGASERRVTGIIYGGKGKKPPPPNELFVTILTGDRGENSPGTVLRQVLRRIFHNRNIRFFVKESDPTSLLVDALSGISSDESSDGQATWPNGIKAHNEEEEEEEADNDNDVLRQGAKIQNLPPPRDGRGDYNSRGDCYNYNLEDEDNNNDKYPPRQRQRPLQWAAGQQQGLGTANNPYQESLIDTILRQPWGGRDRPAGGGAPPIDDKPFHPVAAGWAMMGPPPAGRRPAPAAARAPEDGVVVGGGAQAQLAPTDRSRGDSSPPRIVPRHLPLPSSPYDYPPFDSIIADRATKSPDYRRPYDATLAATAAAAVAPLCNPLDPIAHALAFRAPQGGGGGGSGGSGDGHLLSGRRPAAAPCTPATAAGPPSRAHPTTSSAADGCRGGGDDSSLPHPHRIVAPPHLPPPWPSLRMTTGKNAPRVDDPDIYSVVVGGGSSGLLPWTTAATAAPLARPDAIAAATENDCAGIVVRRAMAESRASHVVDDACRRVMATAHDDLESSRTAMIEGEEEGKKAIGGGGDDDEALLVRMASRRSVLDKRERTEAKLKFDATLETAMIESRRIDATTATAAAALARPDAVVAAATENDHAGIVVPRAAGAKSGASSHAVVDNDARQQRAMAAAHRHDLQSRVVTMIEGEEEGKKAIGGDDDDDDGEALLVRMVSHRSVLDEKERTEAKLGYEADLEAAMIESRRIDVMRQAENARFGEYEEDMVRDTLARSRAEEETVAREEEELLRRALNESANSLHMSEDDVVDEAIRRSLRESEHSTEDDGEARDLLNLIMKLSIEERERVGEEEQEQIRRALRRSVGLTERANDLEEEDGSTKDSSTNSVLTVY